MDSSRGGVSSSSSSYSSLEQTWINEVLYLHSLWHQGPPRNPNPNSNSIIRNINNNIPPRSSTAFKKDTKKKKNKKPKNPKMQWNKKNETSEPEPVSEVEWPCEPIPEPREENRWPDHPPGPSSTRYISPEEQEKLNAIQFQKLAMKASKDFFSRKFGNSDEDLLEEEDFMNDNEYDDDNEGEEESEEFKFFLKVFTEHKELRDYFEKNCESGEFTCLICGVIGKKSSKRFKSCASLVLHSISKTKQRRAHRAFGGVVCRVLGWDMNRLPSIVLSAEGPLSVLLAETDSQVAIEEVGKKVVDAVDVDIAGCDQREVDDGGVSSLGVVGDNAADYEVGRKESGSNDEEKVLDEEILDNAGPRDGEPMDCNECGDVVGDEQNDAVLSSICDVNGPSADCEVDRVDTNVEDQKEAVEKESVDILRTNSGEPMGVNVNGDIVGAVQTNDSTANVNVHLRDRQVAVNKDDANDQEKAVYEEMLDTPEAVIGEQVSCREDGDVRRSAQKLEKEDDDDHKAGQELEEEDGDDHRAGQELEKEDGDDHRAGQELEKEDGDDHRAGQELEKEDGDDHRAGQELKREDGSNEHQAGQEVKIKEGDALEE